MEYLIINGNQNPLNKTWETYLNDFAAGLRKGGAGVIDINLRDLSLKACTGCWRCWHTTPGLCRHRDGMEKVYQAILGTDVTIWASPLVLGNVSALTKTAQDRIIPLLHPFFATVDGECHHRRRYPKNIDMALLVGPGDHDTAEDLAIVRRLHERLAVNGRGRFAFFASTALSAAAAARIALEVAA